MRATGIVESMSCMWRRKRGLPIFSVTAAKWWAAGHHFTAAIRSLGCIMNSVSVGRVVGKRLTHFGLARFECQTFYRSETCRRNRGPSNVHVERLHNIGQWHVKPDAWHTTGTPFHMARMFVVVVEHIKPMDNRTHFSTLAPSSSGSIRAQHWDRNTKNYLRVCLLVFTVQVCGVCVCCTMNVPKCCGPALPGTRRMQQMQKQRCACVLKRKHVRIECVHVFCGKSWKQLHMLVCRASFINKHKQGARCTEEAHVWCRTCFEVL